MFGAVAAGGFSLLTLPIIVGWIVAQEPVVVLASGVMIVGMLAAYGWIVVMGIVLLRQREPVTLAT
jgi:hypothetical protein